MLVNIVYYHLSSYHYHIITILSYHHRHIISSPYYHIITILSYHHRHIISLLSFDRKFVADVMGDDMLQQEGGDALMRSVTYALQPGLIRITGFTLALASIALAKIVLSPY